MTLTKEQIYDIKKFLAFVLRHKPYLYHIKLDVDGFATKTSLIRAIAKSKKINLTTEDLVEICKRHSGGIFVIKDDKIKARAGHTLTLNMNLPEGYAECKDVPDILYFLLDKFEIGKIMISGGISLGDAKILITKSIVVSGDKTSVIINARKAKSDSVKFYYNPSTDMYYVRHLASRYLSVHV